MGVAALTFLARTALTWPAPLLQECRRAQASGSEAPVAALVPPARCCRLLLATVRHVREASPQPRAFSIPPGKLSKIALAASTDAGETSCRWENASIAQDAGKRPPALLQPYVCSDAVSCLAFGFNGCCSDPTATRSRGGGGSVSNASSAGDASSHSDACFAAGSTDADQVSKPACSRSLTQERQQGRRHGATVFPTAAPVLQPPLQLQVQQHRTCAAVCCPPCARALHLI